MSRCKHRWCEIEEASSSRKFVFRCWKCRGIVEFEVSLFGLHSTVLDQGVEVVTPADVVELATEMLSLAARVNVSPAPPKRHRKWAHR